MEVKILNKKENALLNRTELSGELVFSGATPSNAALQKAIADKLKVSPDVIKIKNIYTSYGEPKAVFEANVYQSKEQLEDTEPLGKKAMEKIAKAEEAAKKKAEEAKAEKEEKPAEEKKEAPKEEPKKEEAKAEKPAEEKKAEPKKEESKE